MANGEELHAWYNNWSDLWGDVQDIAGKVTQTGRAVQRTGQAAGNVASNVGNATSFRFDASTVLLAGAALLVLPQLLQRRNPRGRRRRR